MSLVSFNILIFSLSMSGTFLGLAVRYYFFTQIIRAMVIDYDFYAAIAILVLIFIYFE